VLIQSIQAFSRKVLRRHYLDNVQIKSFHLENTQSSCDELKFLLQEQDLFSEKDWFLIELQKPGKYTAEFLKELHIKYGQQKNYQVFLPHLDKAAKESPWFTQFSKHHTCIYLPKLNSQPQFFKQWLYFEAGQHRLELSTECIAPFEQNCHHNLVQAKQILKQLYFAYALKNGSDSNSKPYYITLTDLKPYLGQHSEYEFGDVLQALWLGQSQKMLQACEYLMQKETPHFLIWLINDDFLKLHNLLEQRQKQKGSPPNFKTLNIWGDKQKALTRALSLYTMNELNIFWQQLLQLERSSKGIEAFHANIWQPVIAFLLSLIKQQKV
jgi:DNA polymerase III delta subunit